MRRIERSPAGRIGLALMVVLCSILLSPDATAQIDSAAETKVAALHPPAVVDPVDVEPPAQPTRVQVSARLLGIERASEASEPDPNFDANYWVEMRWTDPRLAFAGQQSRHYVEESAQAELERIWDPEIMIDREDGSRETETVSLVIAPNGTVTYQEKFKTRIATSYDLHAFPLDAEHFTLALKPDWDEQDVLFEAAPVPAAARQADHPSEWQLLPSSMRVESQTDSDGSRRSTMVFDVPAHRNGIYYVLKLIVPLIVVVMLSWSNFWINGKGDGRIRLTFLCLLAVIAYQNVLSRFLPRLTYLTFLDWVIVLSLASLSATVVENAWVHQLLLRDQTTKADRIDRWARRLIPAAVTLGIIASAAADFL